MTFTQFKSESGLASREEFSWIALRGRDFDTVFTRNTYFHRQIYGLRIYRGGHEFHDPPRSRDEPGVVGGCGH
ncbi:MAG: hypothetical protein ACLPWG_16445 [Steroidobacteraceae bacterium]